MTKRWLGDDKILEILALPIPSDYDYETDTESEEEQELLCSVDINANHMDESDVVIELNEDCTIEPCHSSSTNIPAEPSVVSEVNSSTENAQRRWKKKDERSEDVIFGRNTVNNVPFCSDPLDAFKFFFTDELLSKILFETNLNSVQKNRPVKVTMDELLCFIGINIVMGYNRLSTIADYWKDGDDLGVACIKKAMPRGRFSAILSNLHLNDNSKIDPNVRDKIYKIRPLVEILNKQFHSIKEPAENLSVDESMIKFKGRSSMKQYNPMKPIKRGFKLWCLADDTGYVYKFEIYCGKSENIENSTLGLGGNVVMNMVSNLKPINHKVYFDNYFSSLPLLEALKLKKILACGTIRSHRKGFPELMDDKLLKRGDFDYRSTPSGITVYKWKDSKAVNFISNFHGVNEVTIKRKQKDGRRIPVKCPEVVKDYNEHMGGVDLHDMLRQKNGIHRKNIKWWHRIFFALLDMSIVNAFLIFRESTGSLMCIKEFRRCLARGLLTYSNKTVVSKRRKTAYSIPESVRHTNVGPHRPMFNVPKRRCEVCSKRGLESRPTSKCRHCGINLCCNSSKNCFEIFHTE